jgi:hypothetical protein
MLILMKQNLKEERAALIQLCQQGKWEVVNEHHYSLFPWDIERVIYSIQK